MPKLKVIYWHDIPGQVVIREGRSSTRMRLSPRFMKAIESASHRLKKQNQDVLFDPWRNVDQPYNGDVREQAKILVNTLEEEYSDSVLEKLSRACGQGEYRTLHS